MEKYFKIIMGFLTVFKYRQFYLTTTLEMDYVLIFNALCETMDLLSTAGRSFDAELNWESVIHSCVASAPWKIRDPKTDWMWQVANMTKIDKRQDLHKWLGRITYETLNIDPQKT